MSKTWLQCYVLLFLTCINARSVLADSEQSGKSQITKQIPGDPHELVAFVTSGIRRERAKLVSGRCRVSGTLNAVQPSKPETEIAGPVEGTLSIDHDKIRFDFSRPGWVVDQATIKRADSATNDVSADTMKGVKETKLAIDGDRLTIWSTDQGFVVVSKKEALPSSFLLAEYIDIRAPALIERRAISNGWLMGNALDSIQEMTTKYETSVEEVSPSKWCVSWIVPSERHLQRWQLIVDVSNFTPVEYACEYTEIENEKQPKWSVVWRNRDEWTDHEGTWVPKRHDYHFAISPYSRREESIVYDYAWEIVNEKIDPKTFTHESFDLPLSIGIQDVSGDAPVLIRPPIVTVPSNRATRAATEVPRSNAVWIVLFNILLFAALAYYLRRNTNKARKAGDVSGAHP